MEPYHKINTIWKRDERGKIIPGAWSQPEFEYLADAKWTFTEKVDGTNIRVHWGNYSLTYGGRTERAQIPAKLIEALDGYFRADDRLKEVFGPESVTLYGEGYGPGIQKGGGNYRTTPGFVLFDVRIGGLWLERDNVTDVAGKLGIDVVPVKDYGNLWLAASLADAGIKSYWGDFSAEGFVLKPSVELQDRRGHRIIAKIKTRDFR